MQMRMMGTAFKEYERGLQQSQKKKPLTQYSEKAERKTALLQTFC